MAAGGGLVALLVALLAVWGGEFSRPALEALRRGVSVRVQGRNFSIPEVNLRLPAQNLTISLPNITAVSTALTALNLTGRNLTAPVNLSLATPQLNITSPPINLSIPPIQFDLPAFDPASWESLTPEALLGLLSGNSSAGSLATLVESLGPWLDFSENNTAGDGANKRALSRPGELARAAGARAKYPVLIVPGVTTTGLELWEARPCAQASFKQRLWGSLQMLTSMAMSAKCWKRHMKLDEVTGLDPPGVRVRAADGLEAVEYLLPGVWVWGKVVESLADVGYDSSNLRAAPYDWRLAPSDLEARDAFFTRMMHSLESLRIQHGQPAVVVSHSYGDVLSRYFMRWVESPLGGRRGRGWVGRHIHAYVPIAAPMLGTPKAISAMLSGETADTSVLHSFARVLKKLAPHAFMNPDYRAGLLRSFGSGLLLLPQGGEAIWGNATTGPSDDVSPFEASPGAPPRSLGTVLCLNPPEAEAALDGCEKALSVSESMDLLHKQAGSAFQIRSRQRLPPGEPAEASELPEGPQYWASPFTPIPYAPKMKIFCLYGVGLRTEMGYNYHVHPPEPGAGAKDGDGAGGAVPERDAPPLELSIEPSGILWGDGDGTVPLISLGFICSKGWRDEAAGLNPGKSSVVVREYSHEMASGFRGGGRAADHVDILGNDEVISDVIAVVTGQGDSLEERLLSNITKIVSRTAV